MLFIVLNTHALTEDKSDDSFYEELECVFVQFPKYYMKILLGDINAKVGRDKIFKLTARNKSLDIISNNNGIRLVNYCHIKKVNCQEYYVLTLQHS
jgi:hypothetical protein